MQGWEFGDRFLEQFARILWAKEWFACEKERMAWANRSQSVFFKDLCDRMAQVALFLNHERITHLAIFLKSELLMVAL